MKKVSDELVDDIWSAVADAVTNYCTKWLITDGALPDDAESLAEQIFQGCEQNFPISDFCRDVAKELTM